MKNSCVSEANSLGNPVNYILIMHIITCFEVPINSFGAYCILFKTPRKMASLKRPMLILHMICSIEDVFLSFFSIPYIYLPVLAGFPLGPLESGTVVIFTMCILIGSTAASILLVYENRYNLLFGKDTWWEKVRKPFLILNFLLTPMFMIPLYHRIPEQNFAISVINEMMSCTPEHPPYPLLVMSLEPFFYFSMIAFIALTLTLEVLSFCGILIFRSLNQDSEKSTTSRNTLDLQKKFIIALALQTLIPIIFIVLPIAYLTLTTFLGHYKQALNNLAICFFAFHGVLSTLIMVSVHTPYRKIVLKPIDQLMHIRSNNNNNSTFLINDNVYQS